MNPLIVKKSLSEIIAEKKRKEQERSDQNRDLLLKREEQQKEQIESQQKEEEILVASNVSTPLNPTTPSSSLLQKKLSFKEIMELKRQGKEIRTDVFPSVPTILVTEEKNSIELELRRKKKRKFILEPSLFYFS